MNVSHSVGYPLRQGRPGHNKMATMSSAIVASDQQKQLHRDMHDPKGQSVKQLECIKYALPSKTSFDLTWFGSSFPASSIISKEVSSSAQIACLFTA